MSQNVSGLERGSIGVVHIVFFVIATAGPLVSLVGVAPAAVALGNGAGLPGTYVLVALLYLLFSVGFTAMGRHIAHAGAFFAYIAEGLGPKAGVAGALVAVVAYSALQIGTYALLGVFAVSAAAKTELAACPWWLYAGVAAGAVHLIGRRTIAFSGRVLGILLVCEVALVLILDMAIVSGGTVLRSAHFSPATVLGTGFGASLAFVVPCFLGFEATAIFGEEADDPARTIPRATYAAIAIIGAIYAVSTWAIMSCYPLAGVRAIAANQGANFVLDLVRGRLGTVALSTATALMLTSMFAALLSLHNVVARYIFALARARLLPPALAQTHPAYRSPHRAGQAQSASALIVLAAFAASGLDPYSLLFAWSTTLGALCILAVQAVASLAVARFLRRGGSAARQPIRVYSAVLAAIGLAGCLAALIDNLPLIAGTQAPAIWLLPVVPALLAMTGYWVAGRRGMSMQQIAALAS